MKKRILEIMTVTVLTMSVLSGCKGFATTETEYDTESNRQHRKQTNQGKAISEQIRMNQILSKRCGKDR